MSDLTITRIFDAPRELVYAAWTDSEQLAGWLGPKGYTAHSVSGDLRPGGAWRSCIRSPKGEDLWASGEYRTIDPPSHLVFTYAWEGPDGARQTDTLITITFAEVGDKTQMTFVQQGLDSPESRDGHEDGWSQAFDDLGAYLAERS
ncbi:MAG: hypothetical protein JWO79_342 [Actinomycetia bacterium]|jgi:uncharacterized protein YndB with AHSA1/START domain|nr:hypothetical protein [Actinomycetes bacterium]MDQ1659267.1 hypothetical protein [Cryptosporangiaceae bacterium]